jgi:uncharacterized protein with NRDE domain
MCLIVFAWRPGHALPLIVAANRDEFYARPSQALGEWADAPGVFAGRDLQAGGSWLGVARHGRFAALTNIRDPRQPLGRRSRGELVADFLRGAWDAEGYLERLRARVGDYAGFNLLLGDGARLWHFNSRAGQVRALPAGVYGLSNADLDTPWPKLRRARAGLAERLCDPAPAALLELLRDAEPAADEALPDTGVGLATERLLSSPFIASATYGTRASTLLLADARGRRQIVERSFGVEGVELGEVRLTV